MIIWKGSLFRCPFDDATLLLPIKERVRALGPTVRPDLTLKPADPEIGNWVI